MVKKQTKAPPVIIAVEEIFFALSIFPEPIAIPTREVAENDIPIGTMKIREIKLNKHTLAAKLKELIYEDIKVKISNPIQSAAKSSADGIASFKYSQILDISMDSLLKKIYDFGLGV